MFARLVNDKIEMMPLFSDGVCNMRPERAQWRRDNGYYLLGPNPGIPKRVLPPGKDWVLGPYSVHDDVLSRSWVETDIPEKTKTFKRSFLSQWMFKHNIWHNFKELLGSSNELEFFWETSTEFDDTNQEWPVLLGYVSQALGLSDDEVNSLLYYGMTGEDPEEDSKDSNKKQAKSNKNRKYKKDA